MHLEYEAGDMIMIDFAGKKLRYVHPATAEVIDCEVFIAILPYSGLIFCKAVHSQKTADFVICNVSHRLTLFCNRKRVGYYF